MITTGTRGFRPCATALRALVTTMCTTRSVGTRRCGSWTTAPYALTGASSRPKRCDRGSAGHAPVRGRQLLRQRQADGRRRRPAAVRRLSRERDERQGRLDVESHPLGESAHGEGDLRASHRLPVPVPSSRSAVRAGRGRACPHSRRCRRVPRPARVGRPPAACARDRLPPAQDGLHEPCLAERPRRGVSGGARPLDLDLRCVSRRRRHQRDHPGAGRRCGADRPRAAGDSGKHVHDSRLEHARSELLRHVRRGSFSHGQ